MEKQQALEYIDPEDIEGFLIKLEESLGFTFEHNSIDLHITFGELCDYIATRVKATPANDCTTQQAFYKVRTAIANVLQVSERTITPATSMEQLFPRPSRRKDIAVLKKTLGLPVRLLDTKSAVDKVFVVLFLVSLGGMFIYWKMALVMLLVVIFGIWLAGKLGKELTFDTVGTMTLQLSRLHYAKVRRNPGTVNTAEIEKVVKALFIAEVGLEDEYWHRDRVIYGPIN